MLPPRATLVPLALLLAPACEPASGSGPGGGGGDASPPPPELTPAAFVARAVEDWDGVDYSYQHPDGRTDSDGDGAIDTNDAVIVVETLQALGGEAPETTIQGLHDNFYTEAGYAQDLTAPYDALDHPYTRGATVTDAALRAGDWSGLAAGDLVFVDYDKDLVWDTAAIYLGAHGDFAHAAFQASDYYDKALVVDLDWDAEMLVQDIQYGYAEVRTLDFEAMR